MRVQPRAVPTLLSVLAVCAAAGFGAASASALSGRARVGSTPVVPKGARVEGTEPASTRLQLTVMMRPQNAGGLAALATEISTPGSPLFRHYLSVSQFAQQFGANSLQIAAVESTLRADGLSVGAITANNLTIPVTATAGQAEKAFAVSESRVKLPSGRVAYANVQAPTLQSSIAPYVQGVIGLDDVNPDQPAGLARPRSSFSRAHLARAAVRPHVPTGGPQPCASAAAEQAQNGLTADEVATAYQFSGLYGVGDLGAGQTIAMFEEQPYSPTDIATYQACYGTSTSITNVDVAGGPGPFAGDDGESALDIEQAIGLAPRANILVYQGPFTATVQIISTIVSQNLAKVISSSYGLCERLTGGTVVNAESPLLQEAAVQGQSFFISSGDSGSAMCYQATRGTSTPDTSLSVIDPGGQPFATGVGGTTLYTNTHPGLTCPCFYQPGDPPTEGVWNDGVINTNQASGSGGGISNDFAMPSYQSGAAAALGVINSNSSHTPCNASTFCREVPDVAADADPNTGYAVFSSTSGTPGWGITGGTSAAAPLWAAFTALANASSTCRGTPVGFVNPSLYQIAGSSYLNNFMDVTQPSPIGQATDPGSNDALALNNGLFPVGTGYDMATGLGSMIAPRLAASLCSIASPVFTVSVANPGHLITVVRHGVFLRIHASDSGGAALHYGASGLPAGVGVNQATGLIAGTPIVPGTSFVTIAAEDGFTNLGSTVFKWTVLAGPPTSGGSLGGITKRKAKLSFTVSSGLGAPPLKSFALSLPGGLSFSKSSKSLSKGIVLKGPGGKRLKFKLKLSHGKLTITLGSSTSKASITISPPAINVSSNLASKVKHRKIKSLSVGLKATDTSHKTTGITLKLQV